MREYPLLRESGLLIAYVRISGTKGSRLVRLAIDTGATLSMIPPKAALAIGIHPGRATTFRETLTASGAEFIPIVGVQKITLFERSFRHIPFSCHALPSGSAVDGLLGLDLLTLLKAVIDIGKPSILLP